MGVGRPIDRVSGMHGFWTGGGGCILHQSDVEAELHGKPAGYLDAGVGDHANKDHVANVELSQLLVEIGVGQPTRSPMLVHDDVTELRLEIVVERATPRSLGEALPLGRQRVDRGVGWCHST